MLMSSGRRWTTATMLCLAVALSCGRTSQDEQPYPPNVTVTYAGRAASEATGGGIIGLGGGVHGDTGGTSGGSGATGGASGASGKPDGETQDSGIVIVDGS